MEESIVKHETSLAQYDAMCSAIAECCRVDEAKDIRDKAVALAAYARQAQNLESERQLTEVRLHAERRCGELLIEMAENGERKSRGGDGSNQHEQKSDGETIAPTLADLGVTKQQSAAWQQLAKIPLTEFMKIVLNHRPLTAVRLYFTPAKWKSFDWYREYWKRQEQEEDVKPFSSIKVHFAKLEDMVAFSKHIGIEIGPETKSIWWPPKVPRMTLVDAVRNEIMDEGCNDTQEGESLSA